MTDTLQPQMGEELFSINQPSLEIGDRLSESELCPNDLLQGQEAAFERDIRRLQARRSEFVTIACPACGSVDHDFAFTKHTFDYLNCSHCHTIYMSPRPSPEVMDSYYSHSENYQYWAKYIFPASEASRREKVHRPWLKRVIEYCDRFEISHGTLLEIGPGFGTFAALATSSNHFDEVIVVEPTPELAQACRDRGVKTIEKRVEDIDREIGEVEIVVSFEVIEHLFNPSLFLQQCSQRLKEGGLLVLSCPNGRGFDIAVLGANSLAVDPEHVNLFNPRSLTHLVEQHGFQVREVSTPGRLDAELVRTAARDGQIDLSNNPFLHRVLVEEWDQLGWPFQKFLAENGLSSHLWLVAQKKLL